MEKALYDLFANPLFWGFIAGLMVGYRIAKGSIGAFNILGNGKK